MLIEEARNNEETLKLRTGEMQLILLFFTIIFTEPTLCNPIKTKVISTKYGKVQGSIRNLGDLLGNVEIYLGIPYASPPVSDGRFTPTNTLSPWEGIFDASHPPTVCPQLLPDLENSEEMIPNSRIRFIRNLLPDLRNQSEDCLTLSIYTPSRSKYCAVILLSIIFFLFQTTNSHLLIYIHEYSFFLL